MSRRTKGYLIAIAGIAAWSTTGVFLSLLVTVYQMPALLLAFWRNVLVCVALVPVFFLAHRSLLQLPASQTRFFVSYGLILALFNSIWVVSIKANGAAVATVLGYSSAGFTVILAWRLFNEKLGLPKILAVILSLGGCVLVSKAYSPEAWQLNPLGVSAGLLSGLVFAGYTLMGKEAARRKINPWTSLLYSFASSTLFMMGFNLLSGLSSAAGLPGALLPHLPARGWLLLIVLSFFPTLLGFGFYTLSISYLPASIVSLLATTEPVMTAVQAYIFLDERMTGIQVIGSVIILSAMVLVQREKE